LFLGREGDTLDSKQVLEEIRNRKVRFVQLWFSDLLGNLKSIEIPSDELATVLEEGLGFDGSSIHGFARIDESDMLIQPDPSTFAMLPWDNVARIMCDVIEPDGNPYSGDPRWALKRALNAAKQKGFSLFVGPEVEYFYFQSASGTQPVDEGGYFDLVPPDEGSTVRRETVLSLLSMGIAVEAAHHEVAWGQQEIDLRFRDALTIADNLMTTRIVVKEIARKHGIHATFMPKPLSTQNGSGMHLHQSLIGKDGANAFFDKDDPLFLSSIAKGYIAGLMRHAKEVTGVCAQWVNSYKRLVPGYEAPVYITWAHRNRSNMIRVPMYKPGQEMATRIEFRAPDPACNPYLAFAVLIHAGLAGIENKYPLPEPMDGDVYSMDSKRRKELGIESLPGSLNEAIQVMESSDLVRHALGDHIFEKFIQNKKIEWDTYRSQVHPYELDRYLTML
jgi:glutamine synthetase